MNVETAEDLANQIADWIGIYGVCKNINENDDNCKFDKFNNPLCCRMGFVSAMEDRIREAVENEKRLESVNLKS